MTPLTAAQVARARKSWQTVLEIDSPLSQMHAGAYWASLWATKLLAAAEVLTELQDAVKVPRIFPRIQPASDPDT